MTTSNSTSLYAKRHHGLQLIRSKKADFASVIDGKAADLFCLRNKNGLEICITNFGARVVELWVPDRNGVFADIVLGHDKLQDYINYKGERFLGATIGRFGNRISRGQFVLNGIKYQLPVNEGNNTLHGGSKGFDMVIWDAEQVEENEIVFHYLSPDGEQGFPGNLQVSLTYQLTDDNEFVITHQALTDKTTIVNLTHHSFFNLRGHGEGQINDHILVINADNYAPVDEELIPTGQILAVDGTPMDFRAPVAIGSRLNENFRQFQCAKGYDHNWIINRNGQSGLALAASVLEPEFGRCMEVFTTERGIQFYGGNFFDGSTIGKNRKVYPYRSAFALETQGFPDSPNKPEFPSAIVEPGNNYHHLCIYNFLTK